jgi:acyl-coenzyme A thioesterase 1/2/4
MAKRVTLFEPPQLDPSKAQIENVLELTPVLDIGPVSHHNSLFYIFPHTF